MHRVFSKLIMIESPPMLLLVLLVACPVMVSGQGCSEGCDGCTCDASPGEDTFTVTCVEYNQTTLPWCLNHSTSALYIYGSSIRELREENFLNATSLTALEITSGPLDRIHPNSFRELTSLRSLSFSNNSIEDLVDNVFNGLSNLTLLDLSFNHISQITTETFSELGELRELDISQNYVGEIEDGSFARNTKLERLTLNDNSLSLITEATFHGLPSLLFLNLSKNNINTVKSGAIPDSTLLEILDISSNILGNDNLPSDLFDNKFNLKELYLKRNPLEDVPSAILTECTTLEILDFEGSLISTISSSAFVSLTNLKMLTLTDLDVLTSVEDGAFTGLTALQELNLNENSQLSFLSPASFPDDSLTSFTVLRLNNNSLSNLQENIFINKASLEVVQIEGNPLNCSCGVRWMRELMDDDMYPWLPAWRREAVCNSPFPFKGVPVYNFSSTDLTCQLPLQLTKNEFVAGDITYEVLLGRGIPTTLWLLPDGGVLLPNKINTLSNRQGEISAEEFVQLNDTVLARLKITKPTTADNGKYTLQATNAGGTLEVIFQLSIPTTPPPAGGLSAGIQAGIALGLIGGIILIALVVLLIRSRMRRTPYERMDRRGAVEEAGGHSAGDTVQYVTFSAAGGTRQEREGLTTGQRSYGGVINADSPTQDK